jgi:hypothetical protein
MEFPTMLVINLSHREDKWQKTHEEFSKQGWPMLNRILAIQHPTGWLGCTLSHARCIKIAKDNKLPWVIVLEDDCLLSEGSLNRLKELLPVLWNSRADWDIFMGGITNADVKSVVSINPPLLNVKGNTAHFCLIHEASYDRFLENLTKEPIFVDGYYNLNPHVRMFCTVPHIATQSPGQSDIVGGPTDYRDYYKDSENILQNAMKDSELYKS